MMRTPPPPVMVVMMVMITSSMTAEATVPQATQRPSFVLFLTDDQDVQLGGWTPMQRSKAMLNARGANLSNWFVNTPVCCPSRSELLSGKFHHNIRTTVVGAIGGQSSMGSCWKSDGGPDGAGGTGCHCMHMNNSAEWASHTLPPQLKTLGYRLFHAGKWLNPNGMEQLGLCPTHKHPQDSQPAPCWNMTGSNVAGQVNHNNNGSVVQLGLADNAEECAALCQRNSTASDPCHSCKNPSEPFMYFLPRLSYNAR